MPLTRYMSPEEWDKIKSMLDEGVLPTWVAETFDRSEIWIRKRYNRTTGHGVPNEFSQVWSAIRYNEDLLRLHQQFAPSK